jgi:flagellar biogenesis protein FliO
MLREINLSLALIFFSLIYLIDKLMKKIKGKGRNINNLKVVKY